MLIIKVYCSNHLQTVDDIKLPQQKELSMADKINHQRALYKKAADDLWFTRDLYQPKITKAQLKIIIYNIVIFNIKNHMKEKNIEQQIEENREALMEKEESGLTFLFLNMVGYEAKSQNPENWRKLFMHEYTKIMQDSEEIITNNMENNQSFNCI